MPLSVKRIGLFIKQAPSCENDLGQVDKLGWNVWPSTWQADTAFLPFATLFGLARSRGV